MMINSVHSIVFFRYMVSVYTGILILCHTVFAHDHHPIVEDTQIQACTHTLPTTTFLDQLELFLHQDLGPGHFDYIPGLENGYFCSTVGDLIHFNELSLIASSKLLFPYSSNEKLLTRHYNTEYSRGPPYRLFTRSF